MPAYAGLAPWRFAARNHSGSLFQPPPRNTRKSTMFSKSLTISSTLIRACGRISTWRVGVEIYLVSVKAPFPHVSRNIIYTVVVWRVIADRGCLAKMLAVVCSD